MTTYRNTFATALSFATLIFAVFGGSPSLAAESITQTRSVSNFNHVRIAGAFTTEIVAGNNRTRVRVAAPSDTIDWITTDVRDGTLTIGVKNGTNTFDTTPKITIELPALRSFRNDGAGSVKISGLDGGDFELENAGAASITATGRATSERISLDGTGRIDATGVAAHDVTVDCNGVGYVHVRASGALTMNVNGVGEIRYTGTPTNVESHINGVGRIDRL